MNIEAKAVHSALVNLAQGEGREVAPEVERWLLDEGCATAQAGRDLELTLPGVLLNVWLGLQPRGLALATVADLATECRRFAAAGA